MHHRGRVVITANTWCQIIYDAIYAYDIFDLTGELIEAIKPLYLGRFTYFFRKTLEKSPKVCENEIINQAKIFWGNREYLLAKYKD